MTTMTLTRAADILGSGMGPGSFGFDNMIRALRLMPAMNTPAENERLEAALYAKRHRAAYQREMQDRRDARLECAPSTYRNRIPRRDRDGVRLTKEDLE